MSKKARTPEVFTSVVVYRQDEKGRFSIRVEVPVPNRFVCLKLYRGKSYRIAGFCGNEMAARRLAADLAQTLAMA